MLINQLKNIFREKHSPLEGDAPSEQAISSGLEQTIAPQRKVLNVGGNSKDIAIPPEYHGWRHELLDIDARGNPDIVCDARELTRLVEGYYDSVYCSHNLEHYYSHEVAKVLSGFRHVLKEDGFVYIRVPDMGELMRRVVSGQMDIDDMLYVSAAGPIHVVDVIYGYRVEIERSGNAFFAHKTGFTQKSLVARLKASGFPYVASWCGDLEIGAIASKNALSTYAVELFNMQTVSE